MFVILESAVNSRSGVTRARFTLGMVFTVIKVTGHSEEPFIC